MINVSIGSLGVIKPVRSIGAGNLMGAINAVDFVGAIDAVDFMGATDTVDLVGTIDAVKAVGTVDLMNVVCFHGGQGILVRTHVQRRRMQMLVCNDQEGRYSKTNLTYIITVVQYLSDSFSSSRSE